MKNIKIRSSILWSIVGDIVGSYNEFKTGDQRRKITNELLQNQESVFGYKYGYFTDDSTMSWITIRNLVEFSEHKRIDALQDNTLADFINWMDFGEYSSVEGKCFDIGLKTRRSFDYANENNGSIDKSNQVHSDGNGALMRIYPVGLFFKDAEDIMKMTELFNNLTHYSSVLSLKICQKFNLAINAALNGHPKDHILYGILGYDETMNDSKTSGYVVDTFNAVCYTFAKFNNVYDGIMHLANLGDDSDTCCAIYGALAGAFYNDPIPEFMMNISRIDEIRSDINDFVLAREK